MMKLVMLAIVGFGILGALWAGSRPRDTHLTAYGRTVKARAAATATLGAGCFWGVEAAFRKIPGVLATTVGYTGGTTQNPTYEQVCGGRTGHTESVEVSYDPTRVTYDALLDVFWKIHDPTQTSKTQYKSAIFYHTPEQRAAAEAALTRLQHSGAYHGAIVTEILPAPRFYPAEEYHQQYYEKRGIEGDVCAG